MIRIMFSVHVGDSMAHVFRTRVVAKQLVSNGYEVIYSVPSKAQKYLQGYIDKDHICFNDQSYSYAQFPNYSDVFSMYYQHALVEFDIYQQYRPDVVIGDTGLLACSYKPEVPFLKILNRFYVELDSDYMASPYSAREKILIRSQVEELINQTRRRLGVIDEFTYHEFACPPALINGASYFTKDIPSSYERVGINMALNSRTYYQPDRKNCFVAFGTGLSSNRIGLASKILEKIEPRFDNIYVSYGTKIRGSDLYQPHNAIMKPLFTELPSNLGMILCHGGWGIIHLGISLGIPIVAFPFQIEQYSNAYHIEKLGVGINVGNYNKANFRGLYEEIQIDWERFETALNVFTVKRQQPTLSDELQSSDDLLLIKIEKFVRSSL